jgi:hypothetical protein
VAGGLTTPWGRLNLAELKGETLGCQHRTAFYLLDVALEELPLEHPLPRRALLYDQVQSKYSDTNAPEYSFDRRY